MLVIIRKQDWLLELLIALHGQIEYNLMMPHFRLTRIQGPLPVWN